MFQVTCPCGKMTPVHAADAGSTVQCGCGQPVAVPTLGQLRREAEAEGRVPPPPPPPKHDWRMWWWGVGVAVTGYVLKIVALTLIAESLLATITFFVGYILAVIGGLLIGLGKGFAMWFCLLLAFCVPFGGVILLFFPGKGLDKEP